MKQRQAIVTVRVVIDDDTTLADAEQIVTDALTEAEVMAHVKGEKIVLVDEKTKKETDA